MRLDEKLSLLNNKALHLYKEVESYIIRNLYLKKRRHPAMLFYKSKKLRHLAMAM